HPGARRAEEGGREVAGAGAVRGRRLTVPRPAAMIPGANEAPSQRREGGRMKRLHIQIQPARSPGLDLDEAGARLRGLAASVRVTEGEDDGRYVNVDFKTDDLAGLWASVRRELRSVPGLAAAAIVVCEGDHGWDDYQLLHNFNPAEPLDELG